MNTSSKQPGNPLTQQQIDLLKQLSATLSREQAFWVSGYLAGAQAGLFAEQGQGAEDQSSAFITILYGSETGNAERAAVATCKRAEAKGLNARVIDMAEYKTRELKKEKMILIVTATHGEGDPPDPAEDFYYFMHSRKAPRLEGVRFAVLALGDSSYEHFCQTGKDFDERLETLGAERVLERVDCDVDYEERATLWAEEVVQAFGRHMQSAVADSSAIDQVAEMPQAQVYDKSNPFAAEILESINLNGRGSDKETRHLELSLEESGLSFEPGDVLCVAAENNPVLVNELIGLLGLEADELVSLRNGQTSLEEALRNHCELTLVTPPFIEGYAPLTDSDELKMLAQKDSRKHLRNYSYGRQILDVVLEHPPRSISAQAFVDALRVLKAREYSIASSYNANPDEVHLTLAAVRYQSNLGAREGVASSYLGDRRKPGDKVPVYMKQNRNFRMPPNADAPMIMVGPGTGVAPFRAFLEEREYQGAGGKNWLFFGDRRFRTDFLYQIEWQRWLKEGVLTYMDVAFSRDGEHKVYVQDRIREKAETLFDWLENGAYFYVCGDAERMAPDVHQALIDIVREQGGRSKAEAQNYVKQLQRDKRYQRDVY